MNVAPKSAPKNGQGKGKGKGKGKPAAGGQPSTAAAPAAGGLALSADILNQARAEGFIVGTENGYGVLVWPMDRQQGFTGSGNVRITSSGYGFKPVDDTVGIKFDVIRRVEG